LDIILIHIPIEVGKKSHDTAFPFSKTINYGLLSIGSYLINIGYDVRILDFRDHPVKKNINKIKKSIDIIQPKMIGLSCISGFSFPYLPKFSHDIKSSFPEIPIIVGGKDHVGLFGGQLLEECKDIDIVVMGEGEEVTNLILRSINKGQSLDGIPNICFREKGTVRRTNPVNRLKPPILSSLDYKLYPNIKTYPPSIEISRGCPFNCDFCVSSRTKVRKKSVRIISNEVKLLCDHYNDEYLKIYFETPNMLFTKKEIEELINFRKKFNLNFSYRSETRVEYLQSHSIEKLAESGLKVIDLGLESGSMEMLRRMNKTKRPDAYLNSAEIILEKAFSLDIIIKLNILFYIGENRKTISDTLSFIDRNKHHIRSISAYPLIGFQCQNFGNQFKKDLLKYGGSIVNNCDWKKRKMFPINPSTEFSYEELLKTSLLISKGYQSEADFFYQKQYGYFSPNISYQEFRDEVQRHNQDGMPFYTTDEEKQLARNSLFKLIQ